MINIMSFLIFRLPLAVAIVVHFSMRFCGINAIMYYSTALFKHANLGTVGPYATVGVGIILVLITLVSGSLMDRAGRRTLHLLGLFGTWLCSLLLTVTFVFTVNISERLLFCNLFSRLLGTYIMVEISFNCICLYICCIFCYWTWYCTMGYSS
jgi:MFS family permease